MRAFLFAILAAATTWDAFTTLYGTISVLGQGVIEIIAAVLFTLLVLGFLLSTSRIFRARKRGLVISGLLFFFWFVSLFYDFYTSWLGNTSIVTQVEGSPAKVIVLGGLTLLGASSPVLLSLMWERRTRNSTSRQRGHVYRQEDTA